MNPGEAKRIIRHVATEAIGLYLSRHGCEEDPELRPPASACIEDVVAVMSDFEGVLGCLGPDELTPDNSVLRWLLADCFRTRTH